MEKGLGSSVVKSLCEKLHNTHRHIYFDNFFSSVDLALDLLRVGLYSCGTLRSNRKGFPKQLKQFVKKGLPERGQSKTYQCGNLCVSVWQDKRPVTTIATNSDPTTSDTVQRKKRDGTSTSYSCPHSVSKYNRYMGGVDRNDQLRSYYHVRLKSRKHYKYIFWFLFDLSITNAYILSQRKEAKGLSCNSGTGADRYLHQQEEDWPSVHHMCNTISHKSLPNAFPNKGIWQIQSVPLLLQIQARTPFYSLVLQRLWTALLPYRPPG